MAGETVVVAEHVYAPVQGIRQVALAAFELEKSYRLVAGSTFRTQLLGLNPADLTSWQEVADLDAIVDPEQTADRPGVQAPQRRDARPGGHADDQSTAAADP